MGGEPRLPRLPRLALPGAEGDPDHADELRIDLDPTPGIDFTHIRQAAASSSRCSPSSASSGTPKTTGNRGLHVYVRLQPRWDSYQVRAAAVAVARELERRRPDLHHRRLVEGGARPAGVRRLQPERAAQDGLRRVVGPGRPGAQVSTPHRLGRNRRHSSGPVHDRVGGRRLETVRRPVARHERRPSVAGTAARDERAGPGQRPCSTLPGRRSTRSSPTSRPGSRPAGRKSPDPSSPGWAAGAGAMTLGMGGRQHVCEHRGARLGTSSRRALEDPSGDQAREVRAHRQPSVRLQVALECPPGLHRQPGTVRTPPSPHGPTAAGSTPCSRRAAAPLAVAVHGENRDRVCARARAWP